MNKALKKNFKWHLITIDDPSFLDGQVFFDLIGLLLKESKFKYIILDEIEGSGKYGLIKSLREKHYIPLIIEDLLKLLLDVNQFEWGDFYLFKQFPNHWDSSEEKSYLLALAEADTTLRAVDGQYIYIYTADINVINIIKENYSIESLTQDTLENLSYPC